MTTELSLLDVNVLVALAWPNHVHHDPAHTWFGQVRDRRFATCSLTESGFLRLATNSHVTGREVWLADAVALLTEIRSMTGHEFIADDSSLAAPVIDTTMATSGGQVTDLHLVNLAATNGAVLATFDRSIATMLTNSDRRHLLQLP
jgi:hypothetical protein